MCGFKGLKFEFNGDALIVEKKLHCHLMGTYHSTMSYK